MLSIVHSFNKKWQYWYLGLELSCYVYCIQLDKQLEILPDIFIYSKLCGNIYFTEQKRNCKCCQVFLHGTGSVTVYFIYKTRIETGNAVSMVKDVFTLIVEMSEKVIKGIFCNCYRFWFIELLHFVLELTNVSIVQS